VNAIPESRSVVFPSIDPDEGAFLPAPNFQAGQTLAY
jgi:hypothetical protein